jgi:calcium/calmodulin-dependent protein kinase I
MGCLQSKQEKSLPQNMNPQTTSAPRVQPKENRGGTFTIDEKYDVKEEIGRGAFSVVKTAVERKTNHKVAIKFIEKKFVDKQDLVLLAREIDIMKKVDHPNILKLKEVYETDEIIALVMELVTGGELFYKIVEKGNYSEKDAANIIKQMITGVEYLHSKGIAHRDLKPENLLCAGEKEAGFEPFRVVIADFGLSKIFDNENPLETSCGTPDYVAPEVITAEGTYDKSVDMWSAGVITYVLLCGFSPFLSSTQTGLFEKIIKVEYDFPNPEWANISQTAKDFIRHLLVKDPQERFTAQQCLQHPWLNGRVGADDNLGEISNKMKDYNDQRAKDIRK